MSFIAWVREDSRARSISRELGGESRTFYDLRIQRRSLVPLRYLISAVRTLSYLLRRRPGAVIVQAPPVPAAAIVWGWAKLARAPLVIDTHPASFGTERARADRVMRPLLAWLVPRSSGCIVTTPRLGEQISRWGGRPLVVHEAPMPWRKGMRPPSSSTERTVLFVCTFAPDEPLLETVEAARRLGDVQFLITGDMRRLPAHARRAAPRNIKWIGYLTGGKYISALSRADVILSLTCRDQSVPRSAHEAVDALRPLVLSDWPHMRQLFPYAVFVNNAAANIAEGIDQAFARFGELSARCSDARSWQQRRWEQQLGELRAALDSPGRQALGVGS